ncbi:hypothetical protein D9V41_11515 [Aeromicrobium phragmitis]|uniref:Uncharacterized protein n=1 Tax=Aeromicrobium phragmitis TaxID=2478914 RepID=A0A3L8PIX4_9ACTN|nr:hypothetical protein [Aeromicrobium phragmitis]RLV55376.1 hypothetical protein D9V41_11515 [Aeromicrobium phragmitis]
MTVRPRRLGASKEEDAATPQRPQVTAERAQEWGRESPSRSSAHGRGWDATTAENANAEAEAEVLSAELPESYACWCRSAQVTPISNKKLGVRMGRLEQRLNEVPEASEMFTGLKLTDGAVTY